MKIRKYFLFCKMSNKKWKYWRGTYSSVWVSYQIRKVADCACAGIAGKVFFHHYGLSIPTCITAPAWPMCRDACRDRLMTVSFEVGGGENVPGIPRAWAAHNFTYLAIGLWMRSKVGNNNMSPGMFSYQKRNLYLYSYSSRKCRAVKMNMCICGCEIGEQGIEQILNNMLFTKVI